MLPVPDRSMLGRGGINPVGHWPRTLVPTVWKCSFLTQTIACSRHVPLQGLACSYVTVMLRGCVQIHPQFN